jgi:hypothetical protein
MNIVFTDQYGYGWNEKPDALHVEFNMIRNLYWNPDKTKLVKHYIAAHKLLWPEDDQHRWFLLGMKSIVENKISVFLGSASSGKTYLMSAHALITFWVFPNNSLALVSSTDKRSLEQKIWGRGIKTLFNRGKQRFDWLDGYVLESSMAIATDDIDEEGEYGRLLNTGIACVPCVSGGRFVGMAKYQGIKAPSTPGKHDGILSHYGDETAVMHMAYADAYTNWTVDENFKGVQCGNPTDICDPLCIAAEPVGGWDTFIDTGKTQEWTSKWYGAHVVAYDGRDTPNNDQPGIKYPFLISKKFIDGLRSTHGEDSWQLYQQGIGKPSHGMVSNRVITIGLCERNKAFDGVVWKGESLTKLYAIDPAFGGGDRCVGGEISFGNDFSGKQILYIGQPEIIPIRLNCGIEPEEQIALFVKNKSEQLGIPPENIFYDSFGGGLLGFAFSKPNAFGDKCPIPVNSGDKTTSRPVRFDLFIEENGDRRLKKCSEHYSKFVTEMWFSTREAIESQQVRNLPRSVADEGQMRLYKIVSGNRVEVEPKDEMKERIRKSPDLYDWFAIGVEGARRKGFQIKRLGNSEPDKTDDGYFKENQELDSAIQDELLVHS